MKNSLKCKVVMLSTKSKSNIDAVNYKDKKVLYSYPEAVTNPQHLYFASRREIVEGDWFIHFKYDKPTIAQAATVDKEDNSLYPEDTSEDIFTLSQCNKIEATTDKSLNLPLIPENFVEKYVSMQGEINEVLVELDSHFPDIDRDYSKVQTKADGTCIIHKLKDSWTREEVLDIIDDWVEYKHKTGSKSLLLAQWFDQNYITYERKDNK